MDRHLFCFGYGYCAQAVVKHMAVSEKDWTFSGTKRNKINDQFAEVHQFDSMLALPRDITHILVSIPPKDDGDVALQRFAKHIAMLPKLQWVGYISSTGVYGDAKGEWVDENSPIQPNNPFSKKRILAEHQWQDFCGQHKIPLTIFRIAGIYGPGRSALDQVLSDKAVVIDTPNHVFSRIHIDDIAHIIHEAIEDYKHSEGIFNLADDNPSSAKDVIQYACTLLNVPSPKPVTLEEANLSEMGKVFYSECKRVKNEKVKKHFKLKLKYPSFREGLMGIMNS